MRSYFAPAITLAMIMPAILSARSDDIPTLDVRPVCRGIASQSELEAGLQQTSFEQCVQSELAVREQLKKEWSTFSTADKSHCVALAKTGGESSYTELITCMEMARDVRALRSAEATSSRAATTQTPSSPPTPAVQPAPSTRTPTPAPAPADSSRLPSTNEPPKIGADSTLKELERVKADAQKARASEATVRGKLASAEADLQRAKEELQRTRDEAGRATKEAEQAKDNAQSAREAQAKAENKLADAEAARTAAEEQEKVCQTAAKSQSGFGTRLRSWFGHKPSNP
jgi:transcription elongation factor